jgi:DNA-binding CsgD family transcriptional regulator
MVTPAELRTIRAYLDGGSVKAAALLLGRHEQTVKNTLANARLRMGVDTNAQLVAKLGLRIA